MLLEIDSCVLIFGASWCKLSKKLNEKINKLMSEFNQLKFIFVDIDNSSDIIDWYAVESIPQVLLIKNKIIHKKINGMNLITPLRTAFREFNKELNG